MNFDEFKRSAFYKTGKLRFNYSNQSYLPDAGFCLYETTEQLLLDKLNPNPIPFQSPSTRFLTLMTLQKALSLQPFHLNKDEPDFIPHEFKITIQQQFIEVTEQLKIIKQLNPNVALVDNFLLITEPGIPVPMHIHQVPQTITFCYTYLDTKLDYFPNSCFEMGSDLTSNLPLPNQERFYFVMKNDPPHRVKSNEWRFFWFNDFDNYFTLPENLPYYYWNDPLLNAANLLSPNLHG